MVILTSAIKSQLFRLQDSESSAQFGDFHGFGALAGERFSYQGSLGNLAINFSGIGGRIVMDDIDFGVDTVLPDDDIDGDLFTTHSKLTVDTLVVGNGLLANNLAISTDVKLNNQKDAADIAISYAADRVHTEQFMVTDTHFEGSLNNYSVAFNRGLHPSFTGPFYPEQLLTPRPAVTRCPQPIIC